MGGGRARRINDENGGGLRALFDLPHAEIVAANQHAPRIAFALLTPTQRLPRRRCAERVDYAEPRATTRGAGARTAQAAAALSPHFRGTGAAGRCRLFAAEQLQGLQLRQQARRQRGGRRSQHLVGQWSGRVVWWLFGWWFVRLCRRVF